MTLLCSTYHSWPSSSSPPLTMWIELLYNITLLATKVFLPSSHHLFYTHTHNFKAIALSFNLSLTHAHNFDKVLIKVNALTTQIHCMSFLSFFTIVLALRFTFFVTLFIKLFDCFFFHLMSPPLVHFFLKFLFSQFYRPVVSFVCARLHLDKLTRFSAARALHPCVRVCVCVFRPAAFCPFIKRSFCPLETFACLGVRFHLLPSW